MRSKIFLLILCASVFLISCKKDKQPAPDLLAVTKTQILATWQLTDGKIDYYDKTGKIVKTESEDVSQSLNYQFLENNVLKRYDPDETISQYNLTNTNGKILLALNNETDQVYEVSINGNTMTWVIEAGPQGDPYSKVVGTFDFKKLN